MRFSEDEVIDIANEHYNLTAQSKELSGYDEQNFLLTTSSGEQFILKICSDAKQLPAIEGQVAMMNYLTKFQGNSFPAVIANETGGYITEIEKDGTIVYIRLLSFIQGKFWYEQEVHSPALIETLGRFLGVMDKNLEGFDHPGLHRKLSWDISKARDAVMNLRYITDPHKRRIVNYFLLQFETEVLPQLSNLRHACVHNDANDYNILVEGEKVTGLIDFGDAVYTALINNLAIACTYAILYEDDPLASAVQIVKGYQSENPLREEETDLLYYLIAARLSISVTRSAYNASVESGNEHHFLTEKAAWNLLEKWIRINPLKAADTFRRECGYEPVIYQEDDYSELLKERYSHIGRNLSISYRQPLMIIKGALQYLYDDKGNTYIDCVNNVSHIGHNHPVLVRSMQKQIATLNTNTRYLHDDLIEYAKELTATLPEKLKVCYFVNSGSEANDLAIRMARHYTKRNDIIVLDHAYHGTSTLAIEMSPYKFDSKGGSGQKPYIHKALSPDLYRGKYQYGDEKAGIKYAESVKEILETLKEKNTPAAAFICETLLGVGGQIPLPDGYLREVYRHIHKFGGVCIADEVQVGFGRVGECFWGFELQGVEPDMVVMGKPIGNGHPLAAVVVTEEIADAFNNGLEYFNTFGGNPVSMVTGRTVLKVIKEEYLQKNALETGNFLMEQLRKLMDKHPIIGDVRGHGLFVGAELVKDRATKEPAVPEIDVIVEKMKVRGFLLSTDGPLHNVLKIKPPIVFSRQNAMDLTRNLDEVLDELENT
ncbi:MAG: aminotransferase class III-fold pyridoxal phosphate-dependent enzyme [Chitinophagaceae bacterium]|nr:aminotransferase class III-fold pyridoxal phosphate-dependent enzyme [Chitinophagaceae bacterium]